MDFMDRAEQLRQHFLDHYRPEDFHTTVVTVPEADWDATAPADPTNLHRPFGWVPPFEVEIGKAIFMFSPELIARQTAALTDVEFQQLIDVIQFMADGHLIHSFLDDPTERTRLVEQQLHTTAPGSFQLLSRVQMLILDQQS